MSEMYDGRYLSGVKTMSEQCNHTAQLSITNYGPCDLCGLNQDYILMQRISALEEEIENRKKAWDDNWLLQSRSTAFYLDRIATLEVRLSAYEKVYVVLSDGALSVLLKHIQLKEQRE